MEQHRIYRGKKVSDKQWIYGYYVGPSVNGEHYISSGGAYGCIAVDPKTVGQCTGKKDRRGQYIYEDDTVKTNWYPGVEMTVEYLLPEGKWNIADYSGNPKGLTITGNTHDNGKMG